MTDPRVGGTSRSGSATVSHQGARNMQLWNATVNRTPLVGHTIQVVTDNPPTVMALIDHNDSLVICPIRRLF